MTNSGLGLLGYATIGGAYKQRWRLVVVNQGKPVGLHLLFRKLWAMPPLIAWTLNLLLENQGLSLIEDNQVSV